jgi:FdhD protein
VSVVDGDGTLERPDTLVTEEPLEIRVHGPGQDPQPFTITMRTPGNDFDLAVGLCFSANLPPALAIVALIGGALLVVTGTRRRAP